MFGDERPIHVESVAAADATPPGLAASAGVFLTLEVTESVVATGFFNLAHGGMEWWLHAGGWCGIVTAAVAWYTSAGGVVNGMSPTPVLPVGAAPVGRLGSPMPRRAEV